MSTIKVNNINPQSGNDLNITGNIKSTASDSSLTGSFNGTFSGDGTNITGVTGEWDGSHTGNAEITGDLTVTGNLSAGGYVNISSSILSLESTDQAHSVRLNSLEQFSSSLDSYYASEADLSAHSSSVANRFDNIQHSDVSGLNTFTGSANTRITDLETFSSSLDNVYATDDGVAALYVANANTGSFAQTADVVDLTNNQVISGQKTFTQGLIVSESNTTLQGDLNLNNNGSITLSDGSDISLGDGNITMNGGVFRSTGGNFISNHTSSSIIQNFYRVQFQADPAIISSSKFVKGNISTQLTSDGSTFTNLYADRVDLGVFNDGTVLNTVNIGNLTSGSVIVSGRILGLTATDDFAITSLQGGISASGDLIVSGAITSNHKNNRIRFHYDSLAELPNANTYHGMFAHVHATGKAYYAHNMNWVSLAKESEVVSNTVTGSFALSSDVVSNSSTGSFLTPADTGSLLTQAFVDANYVSKAKILAAATGSLSYNEFTGSLLTLLA